MSKLLVEFFPILIFFILYRLFDVWIATAGLIAVSTLQLLYQQYRYGRVERQQVISCVVLWVFGGLTLIFHNPLFIQWKVSILYWSLASACILSPYFTKKTLLEQMAGHALKLPQTVWRKMNRLWFYFFTSMGSLNLWVAYYYSLEVWVYFKLFGTLGLTIVFMLVQSIYLIRNRAHE